MTAIVTAIGALVASLSHLSVSRHVPPPGWGYAWAVYEAGLPLLLLASQHAPEHATALQSVAAGVALLGGSAALLAASVARPALRRDLADAAVGRALLPATRWRKRREPSRVELELERWAAEVRARQPSDPPSDPPEA